MRQKDFIAALAFASHAMPKNDVRYYLNGVLLEVTEQDAGGNQLTMVGTNGSVLAAIEFIEPVDLPVGQYILDGDLVRDALKAFKVTKKGQGDVPIAIDIDDKWDVTLSANGTTISGKLIDGTFPDWRRVFPAEPTDLQTATFDVAFDAQYLKAFSDAVKHIGNSYSAMVIRVIDDKSAMYVEVPVAGEYNLQNARGLIMPMKL